ncbi:hypothetical protein [Microbacterium sp. 1S1]
MLLGALAAVLLGAFLASRRRRRS